MVLNFNNNSNEKWSLFSGMANPLGLKRGSREKNFNAGIRLKMSFIYSKSPGPLIDTIKTNR